IGLWGMLWMASDKSKVPGKFIEPAERLPYWAFFIGLVLTAIGSAYYHADPGNERLVWDRMPLTITLMGLFTAMLAERIYWRLANWLLAPLLALGIFSVISWHFSETSGEGDMRFYLLVQFLPILALPLLLLFFPPRYTGTGDIFASLLCYVLAKA